MEPLSFLYIALGIAVLLVAIFLCATLIYVIQILRDVSKISSNIQETTARVNDYIVQPFAFLNNAAEYIKPVLDTIKNRRDEINNFVNEKVHKVAKKVSKKMKERDE